MSPLKARQYSYLSSVQFIFCKITFQPDKQSFEPGLEGSYKQVFWEKGTFLLRKEEGDKC